MDEYLRDFVQESEENITELNNALLELERSPDDDEAMGRIFRMAHTLKGNAGAMGFEDASNLAHAIEDLLEAVRSGQIEVTPELMDVIFGGVDELETMLDDVRAYGEIRTDASETIETLREVKEAETGIPTITDPDDAALDEAVEAARDLTDENHDVYHVRLAIEENDERQNGRLVVKALADAFDLLGTVPEEDTLAAGEYDGTLDAVFGSAVGEAAISAALEPVDAVADDRITEVTERYEASRVEEGVIEDEFDDLFEEDPGSDIDSSAAQDMSVDDLLSEFDEYDDLDAMVEEMDDVSGFDDLGDAGSFDDIDFGDDLADDGDSVAEPAGEAGGDVEEPDEPETAAEPDPAPSEDPDEEVDDAAATFAELKQEVDPVGFDELQDELAELEFDEYSDEEEVGFDELLGDDFEERDDDFFSQGESAVSSGQDEVSMADLVGDDEVSGFEDAEDESDEDLDLGEDLDLDEEFGEAVDDSADEAVDAADSIDADADESSDSPAEADADEPAVEADAPADVEVDLGFEESDDDLGFEDAGTDSEFDEVEAAPESEDVDTEFDDVDTESGFDEVDTTTEPEDATVGFDDAASSDEFDDDIETDFDTDESTETADEAATVNTAEASATEADVDAEVAADADVAADDDVDAVDDSAATDEFADADDSAEVADSAEEPKPATTADTDDETDDFGSFDGADDFGSGSVGGAAFDDDLGDDFELDTADPSETAAAAAEAESVDEPEDDDLTDEESDLDEGVALGDEYVDLDPATPADGDTEAEASAESDEADTATPTDDEDLSPLERARARSDLDLDDVEVGEFELDEAEAQASTETTVETGDFDAIGSSDFDSGTDSVADSGSFGGLDDSGLDYGDFDEPPADSTADEDGGDEPDDTAPSGPVVDGSEYEVDIQTLGDEDDEADSEGEIQSIRVDVEQVDRLLNLVEGLVTSRVRLRRTVEEGADPAELDDELDELEDLTGELQDTVMDVRLVPVKMVVNTLPRVVRDISREQDKQVAFEMEGESVEVDRSILDQISDPLVHIVRNAVDHGIESPDEREELDKPTEGQVTLRVERARDQVVIEVEDDGRGLDPDRLREEAVEEGILTEAEAAELPDSEAYDLIFHPGLSTASEVTDVSGRGVGMDVVKSTVNDLDGTVTVESEQGEGTTIRMLLPVTVAIADVLFVESGDEEFGVPVKVVRDIGPAVDVREEDGQEVIVDGDETLPLVRLNEALGTPGTPRNGTGMYLRIRSGVRPLAIHCDEVRGQQEVVVKPFEGVLGGIPGLSGATVLGEGEVVNILDVKTL
ncbi:Hpt domain-containing protein [Haloarchaeobius sp. HME9146]|uniref:Hpt domain-containing protein n=1 Tax=Haloarchaeobius sp. HME9146 TaxID=2978732 RepID=UPI0021C0E2F3|nr:Hpt domain-containing protein [Haloarchaeobius sp. HME9146]MCT9096429.1 Hpt domain-containing protein [Haloarchaeobius sp. HME9146]